MDLRSNRSGAGPRNRKTVLAPYPTSTSREVSTRNPVSSGSSLASPLRSRAEPRGGALNSATASLTAQSFPIRPDLSIWHQRSTRRSRNPRLASRKGGFYSTAPFLLPRARCPGNRVEESALLPTRTLSRKSKGRPSGRRESRAAKTNPTTIRQREPKNHGQADIVRGRRT